MAFETNKFSVLKKKRLEKSQFSVECTLETNVDIEKVLSVCHTASVENVEMLNGTINFGGDLDVCVIFLSTDGQVGTINSTCPFSSKFEDASIKATDKANIRVCVDDYKIESVNGTNIKISFVCTQSGTLLMSKEVEHVENGDENSCVKEDETKVFTFVGQAKEVFAENMSFSIKEPIKKVVSTDSQATIKNVECGENFVSVSGDLTTRVLYLTEKDRFESAYILDGFKEEISMDGATKNSIAEGYAKVKTNQTKCEIDTLEKGVDLKFVVPIEVCVNVFEEKTESVLKDIYSTKNELSISTESFDMTEQFQEEFFEAKIDGTLSLDEDKPRVDKILFVGGNNLSTTNAYTKDGEVFVEGVARTNVVYLNDETNSLNSVVIEVPFVVSDKISTPCENPNVEVDVSIYDVDVVVKKGREFYFDAKLKVEANFDCDNVGAVISKIEKGAELEEKDCALELVFANAGQDAWDIAKTLKVNEETISLQNPNLKFPLERDENIVLFYQKR